MLDLFTIFSKSGIVLWCFQGTSQIFTSPVNALIRSVILQERGVNENFSYEGLTLKYKLDNEFELVFVVAYQKILQLSYVDKFLDDVHLEFRDKYRKHLNASDFFSSYDFSHEFQKILRRCEDYGRKIAEQPRKMRTFDESLKSKKTVASMIENKNDTKSKEKEAIKNTGPKPDVNKLPLSNKPMDNEENGIEESESVLKMRSKFLQKQSKGKKADLKKSPAPKDKSKKPRIWDCAGSAKEATVLDFSKKGENGESIANGFEPSEEAFCDRMEVGKYRGPVKRVETSESESEESEDEEIEVKKKGQTKAYGMFNMFKGLVGQKNVTRESIQPILDKLKDHMIGKNVAADIADKLCESVATKLEGKVLGTFTGITSTVKQTLVDALVQLLSPKRRIDILRDAMEAKKSHRPYTIVFCGVNGVGKSTNLAKIAFWLIENDLRVLIAACDTFRAGAVEQLRTHTRHLNALHPSDQHNGLQMVQLYEKGYGKDAAGIAMEAINFARDMKIDVVLIDTAGRMQDNEPLMRALAKLIKVNNPDLVAFVGEALVGNEAVDQLVKFNRALADHSSRDNPQLIDGIVLTKFDTIDDKVGAAISMTYITGQPIIFVGTGQTYTDLKSLNPKAVVHALMK
ncbi:signal recognition particle receptor subunit alpha homolog [Caerostris darwini]|uniref:Signal recognition particle receptor subunit alpha homolog n=1 Tax=Caerostris darwini TaxID=1538125 RepID=A0AAV4U910_9ARAC|nr:signal recognition particle receptor subunit alpha homolog [Caerostris darwini]